jgi:hypothetical protein
MKLVVSLECDNLPFVEREEHRDAVTEKMVKLKQARYRPGVAQRVPGS